MKGAKPLSDGWLSTPPNSKMAVYRRGDVPCIEQSEQLAIYVLRQHGFFAVGHGGALWILHIAERELG